MWGSLKFEGVPWVSIEVKMPSYSSFFTYFSVYVELSYVYYRDCVYDSELYALIRQDVRSGTFTFYDSDDNEIMVLTATQLVSRDE